MLYYHNFFLLIKIFQQYIFFRKINTFFFKSRISVLSPPPNFDKNIDANHTYFQLTLIIRKKKSSETQNL